MPDFLIHQKRYTGERTRTAFTGTRAEALAYAGRLCRQPGVRCAWPEPVASLPAPRGMSVSLASPARPAHPSSRRPAPVRNLPRRSLAA